MRRTFMLMLAAALVLLLAAPVYGGQNRNFVAPLDGGQENPPVDTNATGVAKFQLSKDGSSLGFKLIVANIEDVVASHIHCGAVGVNGSVGVTLFSGGPTSANGTLAEGTITAPNDPNGCGWADLDAVLAAMESGGAYVNVHTFPANPGGEIRGQIK